MTSPSEECTSPYPPFSPPSPSTARDVLLHAFESRSQRDSGSGGSDESSRRGSDCGDQGSRSRSRTLKYENVMFDKPSPSSSSGESNSETRQGLYSENFRLSSVSDGPMNEYEEWKKVSIHGILIVLTWSSSLFTVILLCIPLFTSYCILSPSHSENKILNSLVCISIYVLREF